MMKSIANVQQHKPLEQTQIVASLVVSLFVCWKINELPIFFFRPFLSALGPFSVRVTAPQMFHRANNMKRSAGKGKTRQCTSSRGRQTAQIIRSHLLFINSLDVRSSPLASKLWSGHRFGPMTSQVVISRLSLTIDTFFSKICESDALATLRLFRIFRRLTFQSVGLGFVMLGYVMLG